MTVVGVKMEITQMKEQLLETVERSLMEKVVRRDGDDDKNMSKNEGRN